MEIINNKYDSIEGGTSQIISFIAIWDEEIGPSIVDFFPKTNIGDRDKLVRFIFQAYQSPDITYQSKKLTLAIRNIGRKARVIFDTAPNLKARGGFQPFIVVVLIPDYFSDDEMNIYNEILDKISQDYSKSQRVSLKKYYQDIKERFTFSQVIRESDTEISDFYSHDAALEELERAKELVQTEDFEQSSQRMKKALIKFEDKDEQQLIMEVFYESASYSVNSKKFHKARADFKKLEELAKEAKNKRYIEISLFMQGFCAYKIEKFLDALESFDEIKIEEAQYINKIEYYYMYGQVLSYFKRYDEALQQLLWALVLSTELKKNKTITRQQSQILYELGLINYKIAFEKLKSLGLQNKENYQTELNEAISFFERSADLLTELSEFTILYQVNLLIGNINEFLGKDEDVLEYYGKALENALKLNDRSKEIKLNKSIIQKQHKLGLYEANITKLKNLLSNIKRYRFIDLYTIASFHRYLGNSYVAVGKLKKGLIELRKTYKIFRSFQTPVIEELELLNRITKLYTRIEDYDRVSFYADRIKEVSNKLLNLSKMEKTKEYSPMIDVKEIWIFMTSSGIRLYNYAPETEVDHDLLGGFLTALRNFSSELSERQLDAMVIGDDRYMIYQVEGFDFFILGRSSIKSSEETVKKILGILYTRFWKEFSKEIKNFQGKLDHFIRFTDVIKSIDFKILI
jgi:tetratricopeptide (TPR) repeat protein